MSTKTASTTLLVAQGEDIQRLEELIKKDLENSSKQKQTKINSLCALYKSHVENPLFASLDRGLQIELLATYARLLDKTTKFDDAVNYLNEAIKLIHPVLLTDQEDKKSEVKELAGSFYNQVKALSLEGEEGGEDTNNNQEGALESDDIERKNENAEKISLFGKERTLLMMLDLYTLKGDVLRKQARNGGADFYRKAYEVYEAGLKVANEHGGELNPANSIFWEYRYNSLVLLENQIWALQQTRIVGGIEPESRRNALLRKLQRETENLCKIADSNKTKSPYPYLARAKCLFLEKKI
jgi:hypothetical protein